jgi:D-sedoheptulose 7-phosphate isomerase
MNITFEHYTKEFSTSLNKISKQDIEKFIDGLVKVKNNKGRIFFLGVGGSAANCSHAVNDFRKLCGIECYSPLDNTAELTARINDEGWDTSFSNWLKVSNLTKNDSIFIMSVGGGNLKKRVSVNLIKAIDYAKKKKSKVFGIVSRDGGYTLKNANHVILIPVEDKKLVTPISEAMQAAIWHYIVSHPKTQINKTKW